MVVGGRGVRLVRGGDPSAAAAVVVLVVVGGLLLLVPVVVPVVGRSCRHPKQAASKKERKQKMRDA